MGKSLEPTPVSLLPTLSLVPASSGSFQQPLPLPFLPDSLLLHKALTAKCNQRGGQGTEEGMASWHPTESVLRPLLSTVHPGSAPQEARGHLPSLSVVPLQRQFQICTQLSRLLLVSFSKPQGLFEATFITIDGRCRLVHKAVLFQAMG